MADSQRLKIRVPLGDSEHKDEEKGTTKIVRRAVHELKGKSGKRTGIVNWRGSYYHVTEADDGFMECGKRAKAPEDARAPMGSVTNGNGNGNGAARKSAKKKAPAAKKGAKRASSRAAKSGGRARARKAS